LERVDNWDFVRKVVEASRARVPSEWYQIVSRGGGRRVDAPDREPLHRRSNAVRARSTLK